MTGYNLPPGVNERDLPGWNDEDVVEIVGYCEACEWEGLAETFEGEFEVPCAGCGEWGLQRA